MIVSLIVTVFLPVIMLLYSLKVKKTKVFLWGSLTFIVSQPLLRIPLITFLSSNFLSVNQFQVQYPIAYVLLIALSAGLFEEVGRYLVMTFILKKNRSWNDGVIFGLGHGGVEAFLLVGLPIMMTLFSGASRGVSSSDFLLGAVERVFAIILHVGLSVLVMKTVKSNKKRYVIFAIFIHTVIDSMVGIIPMFVSNGVIMIEVTLAIVSLLLFLYAIFLRKGWELS